MPRQRDKIDTIKSWYPILQKKNQEIEYYKKMIFSDQKLGNVDQFLVYSAELDKENVDIICRHLREFGKLAHKYGHQLIARQECDNEISVYLVPFNENYDMKTTVDAMDLLIERKRKENEESNVWPSTRIVPEVKIISNKMDDIVNKMDVVETKIKVETANEISTVQQTIEEFKAQTQATLNEIKNKYDTTSEMLQVLHEQGTEREKRRSLKVDRFYKQKNLDYIRNSPEILEKICMILSVKNYGDERDTEPPFKDIISMEEKKKKLIEYFDLLQKNLDGSTRATEKQINIKDCMYCNQEQTQYKPTTSEIEEWKQEMEQKLGVKNTIGIVCCNTHEWKGSNIYFCFCIANGEMISWAINSSKQEALEKVFDYLAYLRNRDTNAKFATDMEVSDKYSDYFVHVSTDEILKIWNNHKFMQLMTNIFEKFK